MNKTLNRKVRPKISDWLPGEVPHCEIRSIRFGKKSGDPIFIHLTPRGKRELMRREKNERERARKSKIDQKRHPERYGIPIGWWLGWF